MFRPVDPETDFVALEQAELRRWREHDVFARSISERDGAEPWIFYEGPPTANGRPGLHHVWARVYKDLFCRYRTMRGYKVERRGGWDTHGLPVEVEVEKRLGITSKTQIEQEVGIAQFVHQCRESVKEYVDDFLKLSERIGYWLDFDNAYWTFNPDYIQSVWWHLKTMFDRDLIYEDIKVVPYCPRCGTALASHELGQPDVYQDVDDESAYVAFALIDPDPAVVGDARWLAAWTTTPWTLPSNTGLAVNGSLTYAVVDGYVMAEELVDEVLGDGAKERISHRIAGNALVGLRYERLFDDLEVDAGGFVVLEHDFVTTDEGTGIVHLAPAFGEIDRQVGREAGLPTLNPVGPDGRFTDKISWLSGQDVRSTNGTINDRLEAAGRLIKRHPYRHSYPHCWRCRTALIYWGKPSWYIATTRHKADLLAANETIDWHPAHIKEGRFGEWLSNNVDWALSRDRYWGTPLPIWRCPDNHFTCVGSLAELSELAGRDVTGVDPHRPAIDDITITCPQCSQMARREPSVIDAWIDSGSMPAAQVGYPHVLGSEQAFSYPADFISEAIDQTRGWFYSLLAVNQLVFGAAPYRHVVCLGHIVDAEGRKMSKSVGNVIDPWTVLDSRGADALRWWMFVQGSPWTPTRASLPAIDTAMRETLLTLWNTYSFFVTYASLNGFDPDGAVPAVADRPDLDRWILSKLTSTAAAVTAALDSYEPLAAASALASLVDEISNWYVRRSRRRFWRTDPDAPPGDVLAAHATLHTVLVNTALMMAPLCPFLADVMWGSLTQGAESDSVHLAAWPVIDGGLIDEHLEEQMDLVRRLSSLGRAARSDAGVKVRQPLSRALIFVANMSEVDLLEGLLEDELNVDSIEISSQLSEVMRFELVPNFKVLGPRLGEAVKDLRPALAGLDGAEVASAFDLGQSIHLMVGELDVELTAGDLELRVQSQPGYAVSRVGSEVVALDLEISDELRRRGLARDVVRQVQDLRKNSGLEVADRIVLNLVGLDDLGAMFEEIGREVLAVKVQIGPGSGEGQAIEADDRDDARAWIEKATDWVGLA